MSFANIPAELKELPQWVCWRYVERDGETTKQPFQTNGYPADVKKAIDWTSFDAACAAFATGWFNGIGFVFTKSDPYAFLDVDYPKCPADQVADVQARQRKLVEAFAGTYAEISPSGNGLHIISRGVVPSGKRKSQVGLELYDTERYATFTGNVYHNQPITDQSGLVRALWEDLGGDETQVPTGAIDGTQKADDNEIWRRAAEAKNGELFRALWNGAYEKRFASHSEADIALVNILAFYTQNREQIKRLFLLSALGQRDKAKRGKYVNDTITRALDKAVPEVDCSGFIANVRAKIDAMFAERQAFEAHRMEAMRNAAAARMQQHIATHTEYVQKRSAGSPFDLVPAVGPEGFSRPPGLLGDVAEFAYAQSPYPAALPSLCAALGFMSGLCGRAYNISGVGVNLYTLLVAPTATGKEALSSAISKLAFALKPTVPAVMSYFGVDELASGQALHRQMKERKAFLTLQGEFGLVLQQLCHPRAPAASVTLKRAYLQLFTKSGQGQYMGASAFSDSAKNTDILESPALSILGETAPPHLYDNLNETMLADGFLPRFLLVEMDGATELYQPNAYTAKPAQELITALIDLVTMCLRCDQMNIAQQVQMTAEAAELGEAYRAASKSSANDAGKDSTKQIWSRAHIKAIKLAALVAIGVNPFAPIIERSHMEWAIQLNNDGIRRLIRKFELGEIGDGDNRQLADMRRFLGRYVSTPDSALPQTNLNRTHKNEYIIGYSYLRNNLAGLASFRGALGGASRAFSVALQSCIACGHIVEVDAATRMRLGIGGNAYKIVDPDIVHYA